MMILSDCKRVLRIKKNRENQIHCVPPFHIVVFVQKIPIQNWFWEKPYLSTDVLFVNTAHFRSSLAQYFSREIFYLQLHVRYFETMYEMPISELEITL